MQNVLSQQAEPLLVTVICPTYNHERYIRECLEGIVMQQTTFRFEAVVHDDASTDGTPAIIREYAEKYPDIIKPVFQPSNLYSRWDGSLERSLNSCMKGKYVASCEGDDYWIDPLKLQKQVDFLEAHPDYSMSHTSLKCYYEYLHLHKFLKYNDIELNTSLNIDGKVAGEDILTRYRIMYLTLVCRNDLYQKINENDPFLFNQGKFFMTDGQTYFALSQMGKVHFLPEVTSVYRRIDNSVSNQRNNKRFFRFALSSYEMQFYIATHYKVSDKFKKSCLKNYEKRLIQYLWYDPNYKPMYDIEIKHIFYKKIKYLSQLFIFNFLRLFFARFVKRFQKSI